MKGALLTAASLTLLLLSFTSKAEISTKDLPGMGNLAKLIGQADESVVEDNIYNDEGKISAELPVEDSARGTTALEIATLLSQGDSGVQQNLVTGIEDARVAFEDYLTKANFEVQDMGVGLAASFIVLWELASNTTLPDASALKAGKFLVHSFKGTVNDYSAIPAEDIALLYDWTMTTPVAFGSMVKSLEAEGATEDARVLRQKSAELFVELFKFPHDFFTVSEDGNLDFNVDGMIEYQEENQISW